MTKFDHIQFADPHWFWLYAIIPVLLLFFLWRARKRNISLELSNVGRTTNRGSWITRFKPLSFILRILALSLFILGMARPQTTDVNTRKKGMDGIDIILALDISGSMRAADLKPNRLEALKKVAQDFVTGRPTDRIGVVIYAGESFSQTPLTSDHKIVNSGLSQLKFDMVEDGTAIGMGLATSINRLKDSKAKSKVIILISDGVNNAGFINPADAADLAKKFNIKVYTIAVGTKGMAPYPVQNPFTGRTQYQNVQMEVDEALLKSIAEKTNGKYFQANNNEALSEIYEEINQMETTEIEEIKYYHYDEWFYYPVFLGCLLLLIEFILKHTLFKSFA